MVAATFSASLKAMMYTEILLIGGDSIRPTLKVADGLPAS
jgi:hypothetical protein